MMLGDLLLSQPLNTLSLFDNAIQSVAQSLLEGDDRDTEDMVRYFVHFCSILLFRGTHALTAHLVICMLFYTKSESVN